MATILRGSDNLDSADIVKDSTCENDIAPYNKGFKNYIINGCMEVTQRVPPTITTSPIYGKADRFTAYISGGTSVSGTIDQSFDANFKSGCRLWLNNLGYTNGTWAIQQRIEAYSSRHLNGKTVTVSFRIYHDFGSARTIKVGLSKPTVIDNFGTISPVATEYTSQAIPTATYTNITATFVLGSSDASNGLMLQINASNSETATSKNILIGDIQLEEGSIATSFEHRPAALELSLCKRYYEEVDVYWQWDASLGGTAGVSIWNKYEQTKRVVPTVSVRASANINMAQGGITSNTYGFSSNVSLTNPTTILSRNLSSIYTANAEL